jgi:hypothetical protein
VALPKRWDADADADADASGSFAGGVDRRISVSTVFDDVIDFGGLEKSFGGGKIPDVDVIKIFVVVTDGRKK